MPIRAYRWFRAAGASSVIGVGTVTALALAGLTGCSSPSGRPFVPIDLPADASGTPGRDGAATVPPVTPPVTGSTPEAAASASVPGTETVRAAPGVLLEVEAPAAADAATARMVAAVRDYYAGAFRAIAGGGRDTGYLEVLGGEANRQGYEWVHGYVEDGQALRGTARLYAFNVSAVMGRGAQLDACVDLSGMRMVDARTGETLRRQEAWMRRPFFQATAIRQEDDGTRRIVGLRHVLSPGEQAKGCLG